MDFFNPDYDKFPYAKQFKFVEADLFAGDCLYIPAYFYVQSKTVNESFEDSIILTQQFESHSAFVDLMLNALEQELLTETNQHEFDELVLRSVGIGFN